MVICLAIMIQAVVFTAKCLLGKLAVVHGGHAGEESRRKAWKKGFYFFLSVFYKFLYSGICSFTPQAF